MNQFGEGEQAKICLEIMQRTGAHLELSLAKDQGLSIMVSGKLDAVMKARKDIVARLQTQVGVTGLVLLTDSVPERRLWLLLMWARTLLDFSCQWTVQLFGVRTATFGTPGVFSENPLSNRTGALTISAV